MTICVEADQTLVVEVDWARLDARTSKEFRREVQQQLNAHKQVVFDLSKLIFVDSCGLGLLLACLSQLRNKDGDLKLCSITSQVRAMFHLLRLYRMFDIHRSQGEAIMAF